MLIQQTAGLLPIMQPGRYPGNNLRQIRSKIMTDILEGYSKHVETPSVYKVGEFHITILKQLR